MLYKFDHLLIKNDMIDEIEKIGEYELIKDECLSFDSSYKNIGRIDFCKYYNFKYFI